MNAAGPTPRASRAASTPTASSWAKSSSTPANSLSAAPSTSHPAAPPNSSCPQQGGTTFATGVNEAGEIVFNATPLGAAPDQTHAWCFRDGAYLPLEALGGGRAWAAAITPRGLVVGHAHDAAGTTRAVRWYRGQPLDLNMRGAYTNEGLALNEHSTVVGRLTDPTGERRAFRRTPEDGLVRLEDLLDDRDG